MRFTINFQLIHQLAKLFLILSFASVPLQVNGQIDFKNYATEENLGKLLGSPSTGRKSWTGDISEGYGDFVKKLVVPSYLQQLMKSFQEENLAEILFKDVSNNNCKAHLTEWFLRITNNDLVKDEVDILGEKDKWVLQMADAWGKINEGILSGHIGALGDFHECVEMKVADLKLYNKNWTQVDKSFEGRYCTSYLLPIEALEGLAAPTSKTSNFSVAPIRRSAVGINEAVTPIELLEMIMSQEFGLVLMLPSFASCWPNSCTQADVQTIQMNAANYFYSKVLPPEEQNATIPKPVPITISCNVAKKPDFDVAVIIVIVLLAVLFALCIGGTIADYWFTHEDEGPQKHGLPFQYARAFSLYTNIRKWLSTRKSADDMGCIHGIRFFSTSWVILGHTYLCFTNGPVWNWVDVKRMHEDWTVMVVLNATFSVDTFFVMSGLLATYSILKVLDKTRGKLNIFTFYLHRYIRITPTYAILVGIVATLYSYAGSGPKWFYIEMLEKNCRKNWWTNLLYINNIVRTMEMCNGESWYLANDMQFYILSPFIILPIWKWQTIGLLLLSVYTALSIAAPILVVHFTNAPYAVVVTGPMTDSWNDIYMRPWSRIQTFLIGIWVGWLLYKLRGKNVRIPRLVSLFIWLATGAMALTVIFAVRPWFAPNYDIPKTEGYLYAGLSRFAWGLFVAWVIFACCKGYGGLINSFLSWKVFMPLGRLCFCVYLTSLHLQDLYHVRLASPLRYDTYSMINLFFSHLVMSFMVGFVCTMLFESPFIVLHKLIFEGGNSVPPTSKPVTMLSGTVKPNGTVKGQPGNNGPVFISLAEDANENTNQNNNNSSKL